jgi:CheY-like chemotaxis protein
MITDATRFKQILLNLLGNAIKFTDQGWIRIAVEHHREGDQETICFGVRDTGCGIADEEKARLFKPFSQGDHASTGRYGGAGLGLSLSRKLARLLGGELELVRSQVGRGSVFNLRLPVGHVEHQVWVENFSPEGAVPPERLPARDVLSGFKVLVVDDSYDNLQLMQLMLQGSGAKVEAAHDGLEGLQKAVAGDYHVVLMDIQMPRMDGYQAVATLRQRGYRKPILALTANAREEDRQRCLAAGCDGHLAKPVSRQALIEAVMAAVASPLTKNGGLAMNTSITASAENRP